MADNILTLEYFHKVLIFILVFQLPIINIRVLKNHMDQMFYITYRLIFGFE